MEWKEGTRHVRICAHASYAHIHTHQVQCLRQDIKLSLSHKHPLPRRTPTVTPTPTPTPSAYRCGMCSIRPLGDGGLGEQRQITPTPPLLIMIHLPIRPMHNLPSWSGLRRWLSMRLCVRYISFWRGRGAQSDPCAKGIETVGSQRCSRRLICVWIFIAPPGWAQEAKKRLCRRRWAWISLPV